MYLEKDSLWERLFTRRAKGRRGHAKYVVKGHDIVNVYSKILVKWKPLLKPKIFSLKQLLLMVENISRMTIFIVKLL